MAVITTKTKDDDCINFPYQVQRMNRKTFSIRLDFKGGVLVRCPFTLKDTEIRKILWENQAKIEKMLAKYAASVQDFVKNDHFPDTKITILGVIYSLEAIKNMRAFVQENKESRMLTVYYTQHMSAINVLKKYFMMQAEKYLGIYFQNLLKKMPESMQTQKPLVHGWQKTLWGRCNSRREISLNYTCYHLPPHLIKHIIHHECCHLVHMNHSPSFYTLLQKFDGFHKVHNEELKKYTLLSKFFF